MTIRIAIEGMSCGGCVRSVEHALASVADVEAREVRVGEALVTLALEDEASIARVREAIEGAGFDVTRVSAAHAS